MCSDAPRTVTEIGRIVRRAYGYADLSEEALTGVLDMLSGHYPSTELADLRPRLSWDRAAQVLSARRGTALVARVSGGTIPDRGYYAVHLGEGGPRIGELDEEMVFETRPGDAILLGSSTWRVESITRDRVIVSPRPASLGACPSGAAKDRASARARPCDRRFRARAGRAHACGRSTACTRARAARRECGVESRRVRARAARARGALPTDRSITIERFRDELGDWRVCILTPFGSRLHVPWALAVQQVLSRRAGFEVQTSWSDDGITLRFADVDEPPPAALLIPDPDELAELVTAELSQSALFASRFRENAARALLLARSGPQRNPLWAQRLKARDLLAVVRRYPDFPIVIETYREILGEVFDLPGLEDLLRRIRGREVKVHDVETRAASPFARSLVFAQVAAHVYESDAPLAERRASALVLDRRLLAGLLGQSEMRELIDTDVLARLVAQLQGTASDRRARDSDELHDLLRRLGDLGVDEGRARSEGDAGAWLATLAAQWRAVETRIAGGTRWIAAEDAALYRDALAAPVPSELPTHLLSPASDPMTTLLRRYARTHGPFRTADVATRYALPAVQLEPLLAALEASGALVRGALSPGGVEDEWCDTEVWRQLKRRTLAKLRDEIAPVDAATFTRFLGAWHGLGEERAGAKRLEEALAQLEGLALPWSTLSRVLLPARVSDFRPTMLDMLCASGAIVWIGAGALGTARRAHRDLPKVASGEAPPGGGGASAGGARAGGAARSSGAAWRILPHRTPRRRAACACARGRSGAHGSPLGGSRHQ
jgi:ATP-dependent Lhr-like helicase